MSKDELRDEVKNRVENLPSYDSTPNYYDKNPLVSLGAATWYLLRDNPDILDDLVFSPAISE